MAHSLRVEFITAGESCLQEHEAAAHIVAVVQKRGEMNPDVKVAFSFFYHPGPQPRKRCCPHVRWAFP